MLQVYEATLRGAALAYAADGRPVFPVGARTKAPATKRGFYDATLNPAAIERWWRAQDYNVGISTGASSGVWVLDIDGDEGRASLAALQEKHAALPATATSVTARGRHLWFRYDGPVPCSTARIAAGIDVKADGGYAVAPPSVHPTGHVYGWATDSADVPASAPEWLVRLARARPQVAFTRPTIGHNGPPGHYGQAALDRECAALAAGPRGGRNHGLNRAAFRLFQLVASGELDGDRVVAGLVDACQRNGLIADDGMRAALATIRSGERAGLQHPRSRGAAP